MTFMSAGKVIIAAVFGVPNNGDEPSVISPSLALLDEGMIDVRAPTEAVLVLSITTAPLVDSTLISRPPRVV